MLGSSPIEAWTLVASTTFSRLPAGLAHDLLGLPVGVDVGGVHEVDPRVEGAVDDPDRVVVVRVAPGAEHHRAEAEGRDLDAGRAEGAVVHGGEASACTSLHFVAKVDFAPGEEEGRFGADQNQVGCGRHPCPGCCRPRWSSGGWCEWNRFD